MAVFGAVMVAEYFLFRRGLEAIRELGRAGTALTLYFIESILVLILLISLMSFVASGLWVFYRARDTAFLRASPLPLPALYVLRALETFFLTGWALGIVGLPALAALGAVYGAGLDYYLSGGVVLLLFAVFTGSAGTVLTAVVGMAFARAPSRLTVLGAVAALVLLFLLVIGKSVVPSTSDFYVLFEPEMLNGKPASVKFIEGRFGLWPSHPFAAMLYTLGTGGAAGSATARASLLLVPLATLAVALTAGRALYARTLPPIAEAFAVTRAPRARAPGAPIFPRRLSGAVGALIERDVVALARSPHELSRAGFIALLLALYTSFVFLAPLRDVGDRPHALARLMIFNVTAAGYFLTAFGLRFVFPSFSLEGRAAWVFFSSPIPIVRLALAKLGLSIALLTVAVVPIAMAGTLRLIADPVVVAAVAALLLLLAATTATLLLAFGSAWPNFRETDPDSLATSGAGLAATMTCLVYVAAIGWIARGVVLASAGTGSVIPWLGAAGALSGTLIVGAIVLMTRRIHRLEAT